MNSSLYLSRTNPLYRVLIPASLFGSALLSLGQTVTEAKSGTQVSPPPFINVPVVLGRTSVVVDAASAAISSSLVQSIAKAHEAWKKSAGGEEFHSSLNYVGGKPTIMFIAPKVEAFDAKVRRLKAIAAAFEFLLDDSAFDQAYICVVSYDPLRPGDQTTRTYPVPRAKYQSAAKAVGKSSTLKTAVAAVRSDEDTVQKICAELGIE